MDDGFSGVSMLPRIRTSLLRYLQVAAQTAAPFNPNVQITPIYGNIKEPQYDVEWFQGFDIVLNALDNLGNNLGQ